MEIDNDTLRAFKEAYFADFGQEISDDEGQEMASRVLELYSLLARPLPGEKEGRIGIAEELEISE